MQYYPRGRLFTYEKVCVKRGMVENQTGETDIPTGPRRRC
jgi:hypothetical protein